MNDLLKRYGLIPYNQLLILTYKQLKLNEFELAYLLLVYQLNQSGMHHITPKELEPFMQLDFKQVDLLTVQLVNKGMILVGLDGITLTPLFSRMEQLNSTPNDQDVTMIDVFEKEFKRTLSVIEIEMIEGWYHQGYTEKQMKDALKEAVLAQVLNFRYIDKVLYQWSKKVETQKAEDKWWEN